MGTGQDRGSEVWGLLRGGSTQEEGWGAGSYKGAAGLPAPLPHLQGQASSSGPCRKGRLLQGTLGSCVPSHGRVTLCPGAVSGVSCPGPQCSQTCARAPVVEKQRLAWETRVRRGRDSFPGRASVSHAVQGFRGREAVRWTLCTPVGRALVDMRQRKGRRWGAVPTGIPTSDVPED